MERSHIGDVAEQKAQEPEVEGTVPDQKCVSGGAQRQSDDEPGRDGAAALPTQGAEDNEGQ